MRDAVGSPRAAAAAGVAFAVLLLAAGVAPGTSYPKFDDQPATIAAYFHDHHRAFAVAAILSGLAAPLFLWFVAGLAHVVREAGQAVVATTLVAVAAAGTALAAASDALNQVLPRIGDATIAKAIFQTDGYLDLKSFWCIAVGAFVLAVAGSRGALPRWFAWTCVAAALLFALGGVTVRGSGFFAPWGGMTLVAILALLGWTLAGSVVLWTLGAPV